MLNNKIKYFAYASGIAAADQGCAEGPLVILEHLNALHNATIIDLHSIQKELTEKLDIVHALNYELGVATKNAISKQYFPIIFGGDHSCAMGTWSGISSAYDKPIGLIWIDAHLDAHTFETSISKNIHGMPVAALLGKGDPKLTKLLNHNPKIKPQNLCIIGARSYEEGEQKNLEELGVKIFYMPEVKQKGFSTVFNQARDMIKQNTKCYGITIDLDAIDPVQAPGVGTPVVEGIDKLDLFKSLSTALANDSVLGLEIAEYNPKHDVANKTLNIALELVGLCQTVRVTQNENI